MILQRALERAILVLLECFEKEGIALGSRDSIVALHVNGPSISPSSFALRRTNALHKTQVISRKSFQSALQ